MIKWHYPTIPGNTPGGGNTIKSLFGGKVGVNASTFIREDLQNRVDAMPKGATDPVLVKYFFKTLSHENIGKYFTAKFVAHVIDAELTRIPEERRAARREELESLFDSEGIPVLIIEDYNTTGLNGPLNSKLPKPWPDQDFPQNGMTCFFHRSGMSGKTGDKLGSAGLGRHVYYMASDISTKFVITRADQICKSVAKDDDSEEFTDLDPTPLFFGQSCQNSKEERSEGRDVVYDNYLSMSPGDASGDSKDALLPYGVGSQYQREDDSAVVSRAAANFDIDRKIDEESGTSIIIPFPRRNINIQTLTTAIACNFAYPILSNILTVELYDEQDKENPVMVRFNKSFPDMIEAPESIKGKINEQIIKRNRFLRSCLESISPSYSLNVALEFLNENSALEKSLFGDENHIKKLQEQYEKGVLVWIKLSIEYQNDTHGKVDVFLKKTMKDEPNGKVTVARDGLEITKYSDKTFRNNYNALVQVGTDDLGQLLRTAETPSHDEWVASDIEAECPQAKNLTKMIKDSAWKLRDLFNAVANEEDRSAFADLLPSGTDSDLPESPFRIDLIDNNSVAKVSRKNRCTKSLLGMWTLELLYDAAGMGKRAAHRPGSIVLPEGEITTWGCTIRYCKGNQLQIEIMDDDDFAWRIPADNFPSWADLYFKVNSSDGDGGEE